MARVSLDKAKMRKLAGGEQTLKLMDRRGDEIAEAAREVLVVSSKGQSDPDSTERYVESFRVYRRGNKIIVANTDEQAMYVEFGVYRKTKKRLGYAPLRKGMDAVSSRHG